MMSKGNARLWPWLLPAAGLVMLDQVAKALVRSNIDLGSAVPLIPHIIQLTYVQNTGAAFSLFTGKADLLALVSLAVSLLLVVALVRRWLSHPLGTVSLTLILAGAVGNLIDRVALGYVTDMFETIFIDFAVFNVADICVVVGGIVLVIYVCFFWNKFQTEESNEPADPNC